MTTLKSLLAVLAVLALYSFTQPATMSAQDPDAAPAQESDQNESVPVQYLEFVSSNVEATCKALAKVHGVRFGKPVEAFGNARTATLRGGGMIGVRAPMADHEQPVVRPYTLVEDIEAASKAVEDAGGMFAMKATEIPGHGKFAIYFLGGNQHGLWQL